MLKPGAVLQTRYAIESLIGSGGMGRVYLSRQTMLAGRRLAIKEVAFDAVHPEDRDAAVAAFRREAETLAALSHPNLVDVKDCFVEDGKVYLVMDYVDGQTLDELVVKNGPMPVATVIEYARQLCTVLTYLHSQSPPIIFRDLKPANVMLDNNGTVRLVDFGLAKSQEDDTVQYLEGTPGYAPIEQLIDLGLPCDVRSDVYGLGATLYALLTGETPMNAGARLVGDDIVPPAAMRSDIPAWLSDTVMRMLALRPEDRIKNALEVRALLDSKVFVRPTFMAPVLPFFDQIANPVSPRRVDAFVRDMLGRRCGIRVLSFHESCIRFSCGRLARAPREVFFSLRGHAEPMPVQCQVVDSRHAQDVSQYEVELLNAPLAVHRVLRDCFEPGTRVERQRHDARCEVALDVDVLNLQQHAHAADLSVSGVRLETEDPLPLGRHLDLMVLPGVEVQGEVRWSRARPQGGYESGVSFVGPDAQTQDHLATYLANPMVVQPHPSWGRRLDDRRGGIRKSLAGLVRR